MNWRVPVKGNRYLIDTDVWVSIRRRRDSSQIYADLIDMGEWDIVKTVRQVFGELKTHGTVNQELAPHRHKLVVPVEEQFAISVQKYLDLIGDHAPFLYEVTGGRNPDPADPYLVAVAAAHGYTVVTNESPRSVMKIPAVCALPWAKCRCISGPHFLLEVGIVQEIKPEHIDPAAFFKETEG